MMNKSMRLELICNFYTGIDVILAEHYGFTEKELDFIINYDIKYRMVLGGEGDADADE